MLCGLSRCRRSVIGVESSRVWTFVVGAELAVVTTAPDNGTRHPHLQPALSSAGADKWVLSWRLNEASDSSGDRRAVGGRFQVLGPYAAKLRWPVNVRVQGTRRTSETAVCRARLATTARRRRRLSSERASSLQVGARLLYTAQMSR